MDMDKVRRFGYVLFGAGVTLLGEHIVSYGVSFDVVLQTHGLYGLTMIIIAFILLAKSKNGEAAGVKRSDANGQRISQAAPKWEERAQ